MLFENQTIQNRDNFSSSQVEISNGRAAFGFKKPDHLLQTNLLNSPPTPCFFVPKFCCSYYCSSTFVACLMLLKFCRWNYVPKFLKFQLGPDFFLSIPPPPGLLPVLGPLERYMTPTLDTALLCSSRAGSDLSCTSDWSEEVINEPLLFISVAFIAFYSLHMYILQFQWT